MKVAVVGTGYVGLVTGTCFAEMGNNVVCVDIDADKVERMKQGQIPIYEPGLEDLFSRNIKEDRLRFTTNLDDVLQSDVIFLALPTPSGEDGSADLSYILGVAKQIGKKLKRYTVIVDKSTVPVGTAKKVEAAIRANTDISFDVVSNPEFLREGQAVEDFLRPERVVIGVSSEKAKEVMERLYQPFIKRDLSKLIVTDEPSAEMIKYAANAFLATKISFINQIAGLCEHIGADVDMVRQGIGSDSRIGDQFLYAGPGYGGSCFPKDVLALSKTSIEAEYDFGILEAVMHANEKQKQAIPIKIEKYFGNNLKGKTFAFWGLAFKDNTDDVRESPALAMIKTLVERGAKIQAFDPQAIANTKLALGDIPEVTYCDDEYSALTNADALVIATNWREFSAPNFEKIKSSLKKPVVFDGRNMYNPNTMKKFGFYYSSVGRKVVE